MLRISIPALIGALACSCLGQEIYHELTPENFFQENFINHVSTDLVCKKSYILPDRFFLQVVTGDYLQPYGEGLNRGIIAWNEVLTGNQGKLNIPPSLPTDSNTVEDVVTFDQSDRIVAYLTGQIKKSSAAGYATYPYLMVYTWNGSSFVQATGYVRPTLATNSSLFQKVAGDNKGNFYVTWLEQTNRIKYRKFKFTSSAPYYQFVGGAADVNPNGSGLEPLEFIDDLDIAFNMGGTVTFAAKARTGNRTRILSWQLNDLNGRLSTAKEEYRTDTESIGSISIASHWKPKIYTTWPTDIIISWPKDYMIAYTSNGNGFSSVCTVGMAEGAPVGPNTVNIYNREFLGFSQNVSIAGSDQYYEVGWTFIDRLGIFQGQNASAEALSQTLDLDGNVTKIFPYAHKLLNSDVAYHQVAVSLGLGRSYDGNATMGVTFINNRSPVIATLDEFDRQVMFKLIPTAYY